MWREVFPITRTENEELSHEFSTRHGWTATEEATQETLKHNDAK